MVTTAQAAISKGENGDSLTERDNMRGAKGVPDYRTVVMGFPTAEWLFEHQGSESNCFPHQNRTTPHSPGRKSKEVVHPFEGEQGGFGF